MNIASMREEWHHPRCVQMNARESIIKAICSWLRVRSVMLMDVIVYAKEIHRLLIVVVNFLICTTYISFTQVKIETKY